MNQTVSISLAIALSLVLQGGLPASAGNDAGDWHAVEGATIRLVTSGPPDAEGRLDGALEIRLEPGWKTYWREPGEAGVPPTISLFGAPEMAAPEIAFPAPVWVDDGYTRWAGYERSVAFPVRFDVSGHQAAFEAEIFVGVCETICIPVQARFTVDPAAMFSHRDAERVVSQARAGLPDAPRGDLHVSLAQITDDAVVLDAQLPQGADDATLFLAGAERLGLGLPRPERDGAAMRFVVPRMADENLDRAGVDYTLVADGEAVEGRIDFAR